MENSPRQVRGSLFSTCALVQGSVIAFTSMSRMPVMADLDTGQMTVLDGLKNYDSTFQAGRMIKSGSDIYVLETNGNRLMRYSICDKSCQYYVVACGNRSWGNYAAVAERGRYIYIFPAYVDGIIKFDTESGSVQREKGLPNIVFKCGCKLENTMWLFGDKGDKVAAYDMECGAWKEHKLSVRISDCVHVAGYKGRLYILSAEGRVYCWDVKSNIIKKMADCSGAGTVDAFVRIAVTDKRIYLLPSLSRDILFIEPESGWVKKYESYPDDFQYCGPDKWSRFYDYCENKENYYFAARSANYILILNKQSGTEKWVGLVSAPCKDYVRACLEYHGSMLKEAECDLESWVHYLVSGQQYGGKVDYAYAGEKIWQQMKSV